MTIGQKAGALALFFLLCAGGAVATHFSREHEEDQFDPKPLFGVIFSQYRACLDDDFRTAYSEASETNQHQFSLVQYASRIRTKYGSILQPQKVQFGKTSLRDQRALVEVYFVDSANHVTPALFTMIREKGGWRIENFEVFDTWPSERQIAGTGV
jgi:hypothetical protein